MARQRRSDIIISGMPVTQEASWPVSAEQTSSMDGPPETGVSEAEWPACGLCGPNNLSGLSGLSDLSECSTW